MSVTTRRERRERELRKRQREKRGGHPSRSGGGGRRSLLIGAGIIVLLIVGVFGLRQSGVLSLASPSPSVSPGPTIDPTDPARGVKEPDQGHSHVNPGTPVTYTGAVPPSSGSHWPQPAGPVKAGIYDTQVPFEATTHNLEHGGIVIAYNGLSAGELTQLKQFVTDTLKTKYAGLINRIEDTKDLSKED